MTKMLIRVKAEAGARKEKFESMSKGAFSLAVREKPQGNAANERVRALIAEHFRVPARNVRIISGHHRTSKLLSILK